MTVPSHETKTPRSPVSRFATGLPAFALFAPLILAGCSAGSTGSSGSGTSASQPIVAAHQGSAVLVTAPIDETKLVTLPGNTHPKANATYDLGAVDDARCCSSTCSSSSSAARSRRRRWRRTSKPARQGVAALPPVAHRARSSRDVRRRKADVARRRGWLESHGFTVDSVPTSRMFVEFTGTAGQVREAFHTEIHNLVVDGRSPHRQHERPANPGGAGAGRRRRPRAPRLHAAPAAAARASAATRLRRRGAWSRRCQPRLHRRRRHERHVLRRRAGRLRHHLQPEPAVLGGASRGAGQTMVVIEDTNIKNASDVTTFRTRVRPLRLRGDVHARSTPPGKTTCTNPGVNGDEGEAALDAEWAGASAPDAAIELGVVQGHQHGVRRPHRRRRT